MNTDDLNFAYKVRHALNERLDHLPAASVERLAAARQAALARKKPDVPSRMAQGKLAGAAGLFSFSFLGRMSVAIPLLALVVGLAGIHQYEEQKRIAEIAEQAGFQVPSAFHRAFKKWTGQSPGSYRALLARR